MSSRVLTVCTGNICRSPLAALALVHHAPDLTVGSAGLQAVVGAGMDADSLAAAEALGLVATPHVATQFNEAMGRSADVILVMETHHRMQIAQRWPHLTGKTFLLGQFREGVEVPDPYRRSREMHAEVAKLIVETSALWAARLRGFRR